MITNLVNNGMLVNNFFVHNHPYTNYRHLKLRVITINTPNFMTKYEEGSNLPIPRDVREHGLK